jgi:hypothetical protein
VIPLLAFTIGACASGPEAAPTDKELEAGRRDWEMRIEENEKTAKERAALLPDLLDGFTSAQKSKWLQAKAGLELLEKRHPGFVYDRILVLLPDAVGPDEKGEVARLEMVDISRIIRAAGRFHSPDPAEWSLARKELQKLGSRGVDAAALRLIVKLRTQDPRVLTVVQDELVALGSGAIRHLVLAPRSARVGQFIKERCVEVLARVGPPALPALLPLLGEEGERGARYYAAKSLGQIGDPGAAGTLAAAQAREKDPLVRCVMIDALAALGGEEARKAAVDALASEDLSVVKFAARSLGRLGASEGVGPLIEALERVSAMDAPDVRDEILKALRLITGRPGRADPAWWREHYQGK